MKKIRYLLAAMVASVFSLSAQFNTLSSEATIEQDVARWTHSATALGEQLYELEFRASLKPGWVLYSTYSAPGGSLPAEFIFPDAGLELQGPVREGTTYQKYQEVFGVTETFFKGEAYLAQRIRLTDTLARPFSVLLSYQVCEDQLCIPLEQRFDFDVVSEGGAILLRASTPPATSETTDTRITVTSGRMPALFDLDLRDRELLGQRPSDEGGGLRWDLFLGGVIGGLIAIFTPCVLPLVPLTVNFFSRTDHGRRGRSGGVWYGVFIILIYSALSLPFHLIRGIDPQFFNNLATSVWVNLSFFIVFLLFALSFFGLFEIRLPGGWGTRADRASETLRGPLGIFFMALTLVIVSFSCTGPILGLLLGGTALGSGQVATNLSLGMTGFGVGLALPFSLLSLFPAGMQRVPRSGRWMEVIKVSLAFLELALAVKFLSNADLVGNWGLLKREVFIALWMLIALIYGFYLLGVIRFSDLSFTPSSRRWRFPLLVVIALLLFYLGGGLWGGSRLKTISGLLPPDFYSIRSVASDCPLGLECYKDFASGLEAAQLANKPLLIDFTGWACANCRQMEQDVWSRPEIYQLLRDEVILVSLYTDDRNLLPEEERFAVSLSGGLQKSIRTVGQKWGTFQFLNFEAISQPYYVILSPDLRVLSPAVQSVGAQEYRRWLEEGVALYR